MPHYVHPKISDWGVKLEFSCTEEPGADCKIECQRTEDVDPYYCEVFTVTRDENGDPWHLIEGDGSPRDHKMLPIDRCIILDWDDLDECYAGEPGPLREGEITFTWDGDNYVWEYATEAAS